ncbi:hypothetical protein OsI_16130 [Oryza sativa Indica Group]|uniref:Uncharacterized protein n=1 Tax=Oryza sativa subsp. indica TaxID=39946 RepID=A2XU55_ORYSI|nr:hypothetical protein OsI_16130 [Oryza sativa Indica Group]
MAANRKLLFCFAILVATAILVRMNARIYTLVCFELVSLLTLAVPDLVVAAGEEKYGCVYCTPGPEDRGDDAAETGTGSPGPSMHGQSVYDAAEDAERTTPPACSIFTDIYRAPLWSSPSSSGSPASHRTSTAPSGGVCK